MALESMIKNTMSNELSSELIHKWDSVIPLITDDNITIHTIDINEGDKYIFDFNGLLNSLNIPEDYWYIHCRMNNLKGSTQYDGFTELIIINVEFLTRIRNIFTNRSF